MKSGCPGALSIKTPTLKLKACPQCGEELELFSSEMCETCKKCGFVAYNDAQTCIRWCKYGKECVGDALFEQLTAQAAAGI
jgi:rRNA maturation protein Nop10